MIRARHYIGSLGICVENARHTWKATSDTYPLGAEQGTWKATSETYPLPIKDSANAPPQPLTGVGLYFRKTTEGYLSILKWSHKNCVFYFLNMTLGKPTLGYQFPGMLKGKPSVKPL